MPSDRPPHLRAGLVALVALGGALGTAARYATSLWLGTASSGWPTATFAVNVLGSFLLGLLLESLLRRGAETPRGRLLRLGAGTGFLGGFTTYSSLTDEIDLLTRGGSPLLAGGYALASLAAGLSAAVAGTALAAARHRAARPAGAGLLDDDGEVR